ncbi:MAG: sigma-70 family RNA polymerase sigma factor [Myxococcales bacterium]|nr:sigma-70 family RNA polymerase sigma factor [Myxococcales bacterium]
MAIDVEETYRRYGPMVLRRCRRLLKDEALAVDTMHDVFVNLLIHHERLEDRGVSSLLYRIATNLSLNKIRSRARRPEDPNSEVLMKIAEATRTEERAHARSLLDRALRREPVSTATIAVMHLHDGMTLQEVADAVGLSVSGVRKRLRKLKSLVAELEAGDRRAMTEEAA